jgi:hypothetical protein
MLINVGTCFCASLQCASEIVHWGVLQYCAPPGTLRAFPETVNIGQAVMCNFWN